MYENIEFVICCAGESSRNFPHSKGLPHKSLMPFGDRRLIDYVLSEIINMGGKHITIVCRTPAIVKLYKRALQTDHKVVEKLTTKGRLDIAEILQSTFIPDDVDLKFALQRHPIGTAHSLICAKKQIGKKHVVLIFPDDILVSYDKKNPHVKNLIDTFLKNPKQILLTGVEREDVSNNAIIVNKRIIEKPKDSPTHLAGMSPNILPNELIQFMKKQFRQKKKWAKVTGQEWIYSYSINDFLDAGAEEQGYKVDLFLKGANDTMIDMGNLSLYEQGQLYAMLKLSRFKEQNWAFVQKIMQIKED